MALSSIQRTTAAVLVRADDAAAVGLRQWTDSLCQVSCASHCADDAATRVLRDDRWLFVVFAVVVVDRSGLMTLITTWLLAQPHRLPNFISCFPRLLTELRHPLQIQNWTDS
jgi:hypothetical protein